MNSNLEGDSEKKELRRNRIISLLLDIEIIVALIFLAFGFHQHALRSKNDEVFAQQRQENAMKLEVATKELEACRQNK